MLNVMFPRVEDLERSPEWTNLTSNINDLERLYSRNPTFLTRARQYEKRTCHRRSMPEIQRAKLIALNASPIPVDEETTDGPLNKDDEFLRSESNLPYRWSWKPKTEFERSYFYGDCNNEDYSFGNSNNLGESSGSFKPRDDRLSYELEDFSKSTDHRENSKRFSRDRRYTVSRGNDEPEYSGSRERLHEIFEHNRYLRRRFFGMTDGNTSYDQRNSRHSNSLTKSSNNVNRNVRTEVFKHPGRFGSTETLTSQSNQSSVSSTNGRKSRTKSNTPELSEESRTIKFSGGNESTERDDKFAGVVFFKKKVEFETKNLESINDSHGKNSTNVRRTFYEKRVEESTNDVETDGLKLLNRFETEIENRRTRNDYHRCQASRMDVGKTEDDWLDSRKLDRGLEDHSKSMPNLSNKLNENSANIARLSVNGTTVDFGRSTNLRASMRPVEEKDEKYYASCVHLNVPEENRYRRIPPPLDLRDVNERYERMEESERKYLKNYTVDVALLRDYDRPIECQLTVLDDPICSNDRVEIKNTEKIGSSKEKRTLNKSCNDLSSLNDDLRSPQLVNNYKNSMIDLRNGRNTTDKDPTRSSRVGEFDGPRNDGTTSPLGDRVGPIVVGAHSGTGSTLPSVYGPIPYSQ